MSLHILLFIFIFLQFYRSLGLVVKLKLKLEQLLLASYVFLIFLGTALLMLPEMSDPIANLNFTDALFTATSACTSTGLNVIDISSVFTIKGQIIILFLFQMGGFNLLVFAILFFIYSKINQSVNNQLLISDFSTDDKLSDSKRIIFNLVIFSIVIEAIGAYLIFLNWNKEIVFANLTNKVFYSVFHSVSAFNNSGFTLFNDGFFFNSLRTNYNIQLIISVLIFIGGLGFMVIFDLLSPDSIRERRRLKWKRLEIGTKIALYFSISLSLFSIIVIYFLEKDNTLLVHKTFYGKFISCLLQALSCRTGGFSSIDLLSIGQSVSLLFILLMFIGSNSGSNGGGIKTSTFAVLLKSIVSTISNKDSVNLFKRRVSNNIVSKSYSIFALSIIFILASSFILTITEMNISFLRLLFEEVSAFSNTGLSTGITSLISVSGKYVLLVSMFVGRIGTFSLILSISRKRGSKYNYAESKIQVG